jgi:hypothetical protein
VGKSVLDQPQIPVDLPTYDEAALPKENRDEVWNARLLQLISDDKPHVLTVHAESEGGSKSACFEAFLDQALAAGHTFTPLSCMLSEAPATTHSPRGAFPSVVVDQSNAPFVVKRPMAEIEIGSIGPGKISGREGWVCVRTDTLARV